VLDYPHYMEQLGGQRPFQLGEGVGVQRATLHTHSIRTRSASHDCKKQLPTTVRQLLGHVTTTRRAASCLPAQLSSPSMACHMYSSLIATQFELLSEIPLTSSASVTSLHQVRAPVRSTA
jgi:hypothetical protein